MTTGCSLNIYRRKFGSQTSDNMERWKSRGGKSQRREEKKKEDQRRERVSGKKMQVREKVEKAQNTVFFQGVQNKSADPETHDLCLQRSKSSLAKAAGAEPDEPFGQMRDKKLHAVVARSTFRSQKCKKLTVSVSDHFWKLR